MSNEKKHAFSKKLVNLTCDTAVNGDLKPHSRIKALAKSQLISYDSNNSFHNCEQQSMDPDQATQAIDYSERARQSLLELNLFRCKGKNVASPNHSSQSQRYSQNNLGDNIQTQRSMYSSFIAEKLATDEKCGSMKNSYLQSKMNGYQTGGSMATKGTDETCWKLAELKKKLERVQAELEAKKKQVEAKNKQLYESKRENREKQFKVQQLQRQRDALVMERIMLGKTAPRPKVNQRRIDIYKLQNEKKFFMRKAEEELSRNQKLQYQQKQQKVQLQTLKKMRQLIKKIEYCDSDKKQQLIRQLQFQAQLIVVNAQLAKECYGHEKDLKIYLGQQNQMKNELEEVNRLINNKVKELVAQKNNLQSQLNTVYSSIEQISKKNALRYQQVIDKLQNEVIELREENLDLKQNCQESIYLIKLKEQVKSLKIRNQQLAERNREMDEAVDRLKELAIDCQKNHSSLETQTTIRGCEKYNSSLNGEFQQIVTNYEARNYQLCERLAAKQAIQNNLKKKIDDLLIEVQELKSQINFLHRKQCSESNNSKTENETLRMEMKAETQSLNRKLESSQNSLKRKAKEIKEKDQFIEKYLLQRVKGDKNVQEIMSQINKYFEAG